MSITSTPPEPAGDAPRSARIAAALNDDWRRLTQNPGAQARVAGWPPLAGDVLPGLHGVLAAVGGDRTVPDEDADANLRGLVVLARGDELAARVVVQRLVPGLVHAARRRRYLGVQSAFDELVGTAWMLARTYPVERRPHHVAANLCRDADYQTFVQPRRLRSADEEPRGALREEPPSTPAGGHPGARRGRPARPAGVMRSALPAAADEIGALLRDALRSGVDPARVALVVELHLAGRHPSALAAELRVSERTVRTRRDATVRQISRLTRAA